MPDLAVVAEVLEAVNDAIAAGTFSQAFVPEAGFCDWHIDLKDLNELHVDVSLVTTGQEVDATTRGGRLAYTVPIDVSVRKRLTRDSGTGKIPKESGYELLKLVQDIHELFLQQRLEGFPAGVWKEEPKILVNPWKPHLERNGQFTSVIRLAFEADRQT